MCGVLYRPKSEFDFFGFRRADPRSDLIAAQYINLGWQLVPVDGQTGLLLENVSEPTDNIDTVRDWLKSPSTSFGIATGQESGFVAIRATGKLGDHALNYILANQAPIHTLQGTTKQSRFILFRTPDEDFQSRLNVIPGIDFLSDGACIVPTMGFWRTEYKELASIPDWLLSYLGGELTCSLADFVEDGEWSILNHATMFEAAQVYKSLGYRLQPLNSTGEIASEQGKFFKPEYWQKKPESGLSITTGSKSGIVGLWVANSQCQNHLESKYGLKSLPMISGDDTVYCFNAPQEAISSMKLFNGIEYVGEGDSIPVPPSIIKGSQLKWVTAKECAPDLPNLPQWLFKLLSNPQLFAASITSQQQPAIKSTTKSVKGTSPQFGTAAQQLAQHGWLVFPLQTGGKTPLTKNGFKNASTDQDQIVQWWQKRKSANIGVQTGAASGIIVLDVDVKNNQPGLQSLKELERQHGKLETLRASSPSGGLHLFFRAPRQEVKSRAEFLPGLDLRGDGGYIVTAPSRIGGKEYRWLNNFSAIADMPEWLITLLSVAANKAKGTSSVSTGKLTYSQALVGVQEGSRNDTIFRFACKLRHEEWEYDEALVLIKTAAGNCDPPLSEDEAIRCLESAWRYNPPVALNDMGNAERFVARCGDRLRYIQDKERWIVWADHWWETNKRAVFRMARNTIKSIRDEAIAETNPERQKSLFAHCRKSESKDALDRMLVLASQELSVRSEVLDRGNLIAFTNGVYDHTTRKLRDGRREDLLTKHAPFPYAPKSDECRQWLKHKGSSQKNNPAIAKTNATWQKRLNTWLRDCCDVEQGYSEKAAILCADFSRFVNEVVTPRRFGDLLAEKGFLRRKSSVYWYDGLRLRS